MTQSRQSDKPAPIALNLDTLEREGRREPFVIVLGGKRYELADPQEYDYREILGAQRAFATGEPERAVEMLVAPDDREEFFGNALPNWKLEKMFRAYNEHYGLPSPGEASASPTS